MTLPINNKRTASNERSADINAYDATSDMDAPILNDAFEDFSPAVRTWFNKAFPEGPTAVQQRAWGTINSGDNVLVIAPTGSGKTLAAFLCAINRIIVEKANNVAPQKANETADLKIARKATKTTAPQKHKKYNESVRILYISPMKALGADVERNLATPLDGITDELENAADKTLVSVGVRTGDTPPDARRRLINHPPDILITTPESLYLMLTSKARETLRNVETVIVDEVHAVAGNKRGAHLAISLERLDNLLKKPAQRIGLSATVRPPEEIARFLGGIHNVHIVRDKGTPALDIEVRVPVCDMTAISPLDNSTSPSIWPHIEASILDEVESHRNTIVFVNSRGLCEKLTARLNELYARKHGLSATAIAATDTDDGSSDAIANTPDGHIAMSSLLGSTTSLGQGTPALIAKAHHGSVSKDRRHLIESELKRGELKCVVATSSLELGIDMGEVDLVLQVAPPLSVSSGLQRIGRANHQVGGRSCGIIYPRVRTDIIDAAVTSEGMTEGAIERTTLVTCALDVLAQQTVAAAAMEPNGLDADAWFATVRRSANYATLTRDAFDAVIAMLAGAYNKAELAEFSPRITFDSTQNLIIPRPSAQRLAVTTAGTIPDRGMFPVMLPQSDGKGARRRVGELDEEMVMESRVGDVITLGTSTWRITEIDRDRVLVVPAQGRASRLPFWHGDSVGKPFDAGCAKGAFLQAAAEAMKDIRSDRETLKETMDKSLSSDLPISADFENRLIRAGLDDNARRNLVELITLQRLATGSVPTDRLLVAEHTFDETGDWLIILHSPFGRRVHLPWALAISARIRETLGFDPKALAADDGIMLRVPITEESTLPIEIFHFSPHDIDNIVRRNIESTALFATRFRECAARALTMTPPSPGKRTPLWQQRLKGGQLLEAARSNPGFPLLAETARECMTELYDIDALKQVLSWLETGDIRIVEAHCDSPSPFAAPLMFGYVMEHLYDGDLPRAERNASLLSIDPTLLGEILGQTNPANLVDEQALIDVESVLQHTIASRHANSTEDVFDLLRELGPLTTDEVAARTDGDAPAFLAALEKEHRALLVDLGSRKAWIASTDAAFLHAACGTKVPSWSLATIGRAKIDSSETPVRHGGKSHATHKAHCNGESYLLHEVLPHSDDHPLDELVARFALTNVPFTAEDVANHLGTGTSPVMETLHRLESTGRVKAYDTDGQWVAPSVLKRLRSRSQALAESAASPVHPYIYMDYLLKHQGVDNPKRGIDALSSVIETFEGFYLPWDVWESVVFPTRVADYTPAMLDELLSSGDVIWCCQTAGHSDLKVDKRAKTSTKAKSKPEIAFFPTDSPLAPIIIDADFEAEEELVTAFGNDKLHIHNGYGEDSGNNAHFDDSDAVSDDNEHLKENIGATDTLNSIIQALVASGPADFASLAHAIRTENTTDPSNKELVYALRDAVLAGRATCDSFQFVRTGQLAASDISANSKKVSETRSIRRTSSRRHLRSSINSATRRAHREQSASLKSFRDAVAGTWTALAPTFEGDTAHALGLVEGLLDCYTLITREIAVHAHVPGALSGIYPVLRAMEDRGDLLRGLFVEDMGPAQFIEHDTLERIRAVAADRAANKKSDTKDIEDIMADSYRKDTTDNPDENIIVIAAEDPIWLYGSAIPWPEVAFKAAGNSPALDIAQLTVRPKKAPGSILAVHNGIPALLAATKLKNLIAFTENENLLRLAAKALLTHVERTSKAQGSAGSRIKIIIETFNGIPINDVPLADFLKSQGLIWTPEGLRFYVNPF